MQSSASTSEELAHHYTTAIDACCKIAQAYFYLGRLTEAQHVLRSTQHLIETGDAKPQDCLKLFLLSGQILTIDHFLNGTDANPLFEQLREARQIAETAQDQQGMADVLGLLGQAHYFATLTARVERGASPNSAQDQGDYQEALAYQQQALELREALHDTRGQAESHFYIGIVHERWQQRDLAKEQYTKALEMAEHFHHLFEQSEPTRHLAGIAFVTGDLEAALSYALRALSLREAADFRPHLPFDHLLLSDIYRAKGERAKAVLHAEMASALAKALGSPRTIARTNACLERLNEP
jgi:tetratricopeptide (TPR) repeat protein